MRCEIQWADPATGRPTPDRNDAVGVVWREAFCVPCDGADGGAVRYGATRRFPVCAEHVGRLPLPHWIFEPFEGEVK